MHQENCTLPIDELSARQGTLPIDELSARQGTKGNITNLVETAKEAKKLGSINTHTVFSSLTNTENSHFADSSVSSNSRQKSHTIIEHQLKINNLKIKPPFSYGNNTILDLYSNNEEIYFESPSMLIPFNYIINKNKLTLTLCEYKSSKYTEQLNKILNKIILCAKKKYPKLFENKKYKNPLINKLFYPLLFQFDNIRYNEIEIYNKFQEKILIEDIEQNDRITIIYNLKNIWINNLYYSINLNLIQIRRDNYINRGYKFIDQECKTSYISLINKQEKIDKVITPLITRKEVPNLQDIINMRKKIFSKIKN
jgi:hypothetical protein